MTRPKTYEATLHFFEGFYHTLADDACSCPEHEKEAIDVLAKARGES